MVLARRKTSVFTSDVFGIFFMALEVLKRINIPVEVPDPKFLIKKLAIIEKCYKI